MNDNLNALSILPAVMMLAVGTLMTVQVGCEMLEQAQPSYHEFVRAICGISYPAK